MESFHQIMIQHLLGSANVFKYNWLEFWIDFSKLDDENQFTGEEYRSEMVNQILPKIHTYDLSDEQQRYLMLLRHDMFLNETEEGFTVIVPKNYADKIKIILNRLTSKKTIQLFNGEDINNFSKRPDLLLWFSLVLKRDELVLGKILSTEEMQDAFRKKLDEQSEITDDLEEIIRDLRCADQFQKDFIEFLNAQDD